MTWLVNAAFVAKMRMDRSVVDDSTVLSASPTAVHLNPLLTIQAANSA
jgi:hypothetical protein